MPSSWKCVPRSSSLGVPWEMQAVRPTLDLRRLVLPRNRGCVCKVNLDKQHFLAGIKQPRSENYIQGPQALSCQWLSDQRQIISRHLTLPISEMGITPLSLFAYLIIIKEEKIVNLFSTGQVWKHVSRWQAKCTYKLERRIFLRNDILFTA